MPAPTKINAGPTKAFFVRMLTRDIELADAILDLLDNCVDGVVRELKRLDKPTAGEKPYKNYWAHIVATPERFEIWDNCGGIPQDIAEKSAFMLGRPDPTLDSDVATVGMYGIGMAALSSNGRRPQRSGLSANHRTLRGQHTTRVARQRARSIQRSRRQQRSMEARPRPDFFSFYRQRHKNYGYRTQSSLTSPEAI